MKDPARFLLYSNSAAIRGNYFIISIGKRTDSIPCQFKLESFDSMSLIGVSISDLIKIGPVTGRNFPVFSENIFFSN